MSVPTELWMLQQDFLAALYGEGAGPLECIDGAGLAAEARLGIYRHASELIHLGALVTSFPAVRSLVGEAYFERVAMAYRRSHPSLSGNLQGFGEDFPEFLAGRPETAAWPYLGDVARLEWRRQSCALAADEPALDPAGFAAYLATAGEDIVLHLQPSLRLLSSRHPVASIWRYALAAGEAARPAMHDNGEWVALWQEDGGVVVSTLQPASFACLEMLAVGQPLSRAHARAAELDPGFDIVAFIHALVGSGRIVRMASVDPPRVAGRESDAVLGCSRPPLPPRRPA